MAERGRGRPKFEPTEGDRNRVRTMVAAGIDREMIAKCLGDKGIDQKTLRKHFRQELDNSLVLANATIAGRLYEMARTSNNPAWALFWLKTRAGFRETNRLEHTGPDGERLNTLADLDRLIAAAQKTE